MAQIEISWAFWWAVVGVLVLAFWVGDHLRRVSSGQIRRLSETPDPYPEKDRKGIVVAMLMFSAAFIGMTVQGVLTRDWDLTVLGAVSCIYGALGTYVVLIRGSELKRRMAAFEPPSHGQTLSPIASFFLIATSLGTIVVLGLLIASVIRQDWAVAWVVAVFVPFSVAATYVSVRARR